MLEGFLLTRLQIAPLRAACPPTTRFVMVTATLAASVFAQLMQEFPGILPAFGPGGHTSLCNGSFPHSTGPAIIGCSASPHLIDC